MGLCDALQDETISHDEAELLLFSPHMMRLCKNIAASKLLLDLIHLGTELHSIKRLVGTDEWNRSLNEIRENARFVLAQSEVTDSQLDSWVDRLLGNDSCRS